MFYVLVTVKITFQVKFSISVFHKKASVLLYLKTAAESLLGGSRVRVLRVGILKGMETLKNGILKGAVIIAHVVR